MTSRQAIKGRVNALVVAFESLRVFRHSVILATSRRKCPTREFRDFGRSSLDNRNRFLSRSAPAHHVAMEEPSSTPGNS